MRGLFNFKLYEVLVRFGIPLLEAGDDGSFQQLLRLTLRVDFLSSVRAAVIAVAAAPVTGMVLGWDDSLTRMTMLYSSVLLTFGFGTAKGVLRIFDRYDVLGIQLMVAPVLRLVGVVLVMMLSPSVLMFVIALTIATAVGNIYLIVYGWAELGRQIGNFKLRGHSLSGWRQEFPDLGKFVVIVYWQANMDMLSKHVSILLAGTFLGPAVAGLLRLARETTKILAKPGALLRQVIFPDLVRLWVRGAAEFSTLLMRAILITAALGLVFVIASIPGGSVLLTYAIGADYAVVAPLMSLLLLATTLEFIATVLRSAGYAMGHAGKILRLHIVASVLYLILFVVLTSYTGLVGPGLAACLSSLVPLTGIGLLVVKGIRAQRIVSSQ